MENCGCPSNGGIGFVLGRQLVWKNNGKDGSFSGVAVMARTVLLVTKSLMVNMRWGVNFSADLRKKLPYLMVNKICVERVEKVKEKEVEKNSGECNVGDLELLKGMCFWMKRDLKALEMENREMKQALEETRTRIVTKKCDFKAGDGLGKKVSPPTGESASGNGCSASIIH
ncbi:hypothetical protein CJ030_MR6G018846 [Morella rubra]|uniref:Uncharacterized protein n=1 Tax=Morella rubra TaxID=262757 RepID=A0A6A1VCD7_9ROSI|nr:hypothetical protein CJ030_MR6G018846 [Morella rubra]